MKESSIHQIVGERKSLQGTGNEMLKRICRINLDTK